VEKVVAVPEPKAKYYVKLKPDLSEAKRKMRAKRIRKLRMFLAQNPGASMAEKMKAIKVKSPNTIRQYEHEIERAKSE